MKRIKLIRSLRSHIFTPSAEDGYASSATFGTRCARMTGASILLCYTLAFVISVTTANAAQYDIRDFGAQNDTNFVSTNAIQNAINRCAENGGGTVIVPTGHFVTGTITLKSNVELHLQSGAQLLGSRNLDDYVKIQPQYVSLRTQQPTIQLIYAENQHHITISGYGTIDGRGQGFPKLSWDDEGITRPHLLRFVTCSNINVKNVTLKNSACWMQHYLACDNLHIDGLTIFNRNNYNNDALDIDGCKNVTVSNIIADSDDDGITLKSTSPKPCENITISNCIISSRCNAIKLGTESNGGFKNINVNNCIVKPSDQKIPKFFGLDQGIAAIALEIVDGGIMDGINVANINVQGTEAPIFIRLAHRARPYQQNTTVGNVGIIQNVNISNVTVREAGKTGCSITGIPNHTVNGVTITNLHYQQQGGVITDSINTNVQEKIKDYPEATMFGILPTHGLFIRHATNITIDGAQLSTTNTDQRHTLWLDDVKHATFRNVQLKGKKIAKEQAHLINTQNVIFE